MQKVHHVERFKPQIDEKTFFRKVILDLAKDEMVPSQVFDSKLNIQIINEEYLYVMANTKVEYTGSVGYEDNNSNIDWKPYSGSNVATTGVVVWNDKTDGIETVEKDIDTDEWLEKSKKEGFFKGDQHFFETEEEMRINADSLARAERYSLRECAWSNMPGDKRELNSVKGSVDVTQVIGLILPKYLVQYTYKEKEYTASEYPVGKPNYKITKPHEDVKPTLLYSLSSIGLTLAGIAIFIMGFENAFSQGNGAFLLLCLVGVSAFIIKKFIKSKFYLAIKREKLEKTIKILEEKGCLPLTEEEKKDILN